MENVTKEELDARQERCLYCKHIDTTDGYCYKHNKDCWLIEWCDNFEFYID